MQRADRRKYHYIYKITRDDGRFYIGMHSTDVLDDGYFGSGKIITRSIKKHGLARHVKEILEFCESRDELKAREKILITDEMRGAVLCMNIAPGGGGGFHDDAHQQKCASAGGKVGGKITMAVLNTDKAVRVKIINTRKQNGSLATYGMLGKTHSAQSKSLMSEKASGQNGSQYGTCWITDGTKSVKIKKEQLNEYLAKGFVRGRKM